MKKIIFRIALFLLLFQSFEIAAQDILSGKDLSSVVVDNLSNEEIYKFKKQLDANKTTMEQMEPIAISKGMSTTEFAKLKARLNLLQNTSNSSAASSREVKLVQEKVNNTKVKDQENSIIFGSELFDNPNLNFEPNLQLATPVNYVLGPGDELLVSIYGVQEFAAKVPVSNEGKVSIQYVGQVSVAGMTIEAATQRIKAAIARIYSTVNSGQSQVSVTLSQIRTIRVTVIGGKQPGNYSVSSLATVYHALHLAGGPGANGSYRNIELLRNDKVYKYIDIYNFLVNGNQSDNIGLKDNDVIRIPAYSTRVTLVGEVKRPGVFEMKKGETFASLINFASGFNEFAYTETINVTQNTGKEYKVQDLSKNDFKTYQPLSGDVFKITKILNRFENRVKIEGAVFRPDYYSYTEGMRVSDLIGNAEGLKEDAYSKRAKIIRLKTDLTTEIVTVDLAAALQGNLEANIKLKREDIVTIYSILEFEEEYKITIDGEIKNPGEYTFYENITLNDLIIQVGGLTGSASKKVEIARMVKQEEIDNSNPNRVELLSFEINIDNNEQIQNFVLKPFDVITIRKAGVFEKPQMVNIRGAVPYPGNYVLVNKKETIYNIVMRAGGLKTNANIDGVKIRRPINQDQINALDEVNTSGKDSLNTDILNNAKYAIIPVNWNKIEKNKNHFSNVTLFPGDEIEVVEFNEGVKVAGNVLLNSEIPFRKTKGLRYYVNAVGGANNKGWMKKAYVVYPNGKADVAASFLFFRSFPKVTPGSQIVIPAKPDRAKMSTGEWVSIGSVLTSLALLIVTAFK